MQNIQARHQPITTIQFLPQTTFLAQAHPEFPPTSILRSNFSPHSQSFPNDYAANLLASVERQGVNSLTWGLARAAAGYRRAIHRVNSSLRAQFASQILTGDHPQRPARPGADPSCSQLGENEHQQAARSHGKVARGKKSAPQVKFLNFAQSVLLSPAERARRVEMRIMCAALSSNGACERKRQAGISGFAPGRDSGENYIDNARLLRSRLAPIAIVECNSRMAKSTVAECSLLSRG